MKQELRKPIGSSFEQTIFEYLRLVNLPRPISKWSYLKTDLGAISGNESSFFAAKTVDSTNTYCGLKPGFLLGSAE